ncbi:MAG TPA: hypothetical protein VLL52_06910 [Anaerolineae bacterium]|nr:hypothetical protein [Anaerolineae bacterium]
MNEHDELEDVMAKLSLLAPSAEDAPTPPAEAWARWQDKVGEQVASRPVKESWSWRALWPKPSRAWAGALAMLAIVLLFALPPVRVAASDFLSLFRVQKFAPISVSPAQLAALEKVADKGLYPGEFTIIEEAGPTVIAEDYDDALNLLGYMPGRLRSLGVADEIEIEPASSGRLRVNLDNLREIVATMDVDPDLLPDSLDGADVAVAIKPIVVQKWSEEQLVLVQMVSPYVDYPADVDPAAMGQILLQMLGMPERDARRLAANIDWTNTLLLPIPTELASFREVRVMDVTGLAITTLDGKSTTLLWERDNMVFMLAGNRSAEALSELVGDSLMYRVE